MSTFGWTVLPVAHCLEPIDGFAIFRLVNGYMAHRGLCRCAVPVPLTGTEPDDVSGRYGFHRATFTLNPAAAGSDDQRLAKWMRVPVRPRARLESDKRHCGARGLDRFMQGIDTYRAGKPFFRPLPRWFRSAFRYLHGRAHLHVFWILLSQLGAIAGCTTRSRIAFSRKPRAPFRTRAANCSAEVNDQAPIFPPPCFVTTSTEGRGGMLSAKSGQRVGGFSNVASPSSPGC